MKKVCRLIRDLVALEPLRRMRSDGGILFDMSRMDDRRQWRVLNVSYNVWKQGEIKVGDHVITQGVVEPEHEFTDGVIICRVAWVVGVIFNTAADCRARFGQAEVRTPVENGANDGTPSPVPAQN